MLPRNAFLLCCLLAGVGEAVAQDALLLYHLEAVPKRLMLNPAAPVAHRAWLSLPLVGHADQTVQTPFRLGEVLNLSGTTLRALADETSAVAFDDLEIDAPAAIDALDPLGRARVTTRVNLLSFGIHLPQGLFSLNVDQQADLYAAAGPDILAGLYLGETYLRANGVDTRGHNYDANLRTSYSFGYQVKPGDGALRLGANVKLVKVQAHAHLRDLDVEVTPEGRESVTVFYEGHSRASGFADFRDERAGSEDLTWRQAFTGGNWGLGVDLGAHYQYTERLHLSASLTDLGLVRLGDQSREYEFHNTLRRGDSQPLASRETVTVARAVEETEVFAGDGRPRIINNDAYTRPLPTTLYLGGEYRFAGSNSAGLVVRNSLRGGRLQTAAAASLNLRPWRVLEASTSVSWADGAGVGVGFGASFQLSVLQVYVGTDNLLAFRDLERARWANAFAGVTFLLPEKREVRVGKAGSSSGQRRRREPAVKCYEF